MVDAGIIVPCIKHLSSNNPDIAFNAACILSALPINDDTSAIVVDEGAIDPLVRCLSSHHSPHVTAEAARVLGFISLEDRLGELVTECGCCDILLGLVLMEPQVSNLLDIKMFRTEMCYVHTKIVNTSSITSLH